LQGFQALSYERLRLLFRDAFGLIVSEARSGRMLRNRLENMFNALPLSVEKEIPSKAV